MSDRWVEEVDGSQVVNGTTEQTKDLDFTQRQWESIEDRVLQAGTSLIRLRGALVVGRAGTGGTITAAESRPPQERVSEAGQGAGRGEERLMQGFTRVPSLQL